MQNIDVLDRLCLRAHRGNIAVLHKFEKASRPKNLIYFMKLSVAVVFVMTLSVQLLVAETGKGQSRVPGTDAGKVVKDEKKITIGCKNESLRSVLKQLEKLSGYRIAFPSAEVSRYTNITLSTETRSVRLTLELILGSTPFDFTYNGNTIILFEKPAIEPVKTVDPAPRRVPELTAAALIRGRVVDDKSGESLSDVSVMVKGSAVGMNTNKDGEFSLSFAGTGRIILTISHIGYADKEVIARPDIYNTIRLSVSDQSLAGVEVSTGMFKRKKESFTGATASFTGDQLRAVGNRNVIQSLKTLDPSFIVVENNRAGANPNTLPTIELRGKTSVTTTTTTKDLRNQYAADPNLPLFILNGFPTTLEIVNNLDMNRVATITILKDAASTAIWGSKAANGVVVIETKKPVAGELRVSVSNDLLMDLPDLSSYNMMNAREKLQFEKLSGLYTVDYAQFAAD